MYKKFLFLYKQRNLFDLFRIVIDRIFPFNSTSFKSCQKILEGKTGIEIGGPSYLFSREGAFPIYPIIKNLDNCNFAENTLWEGKLLEGDTFDYDQEHTYGYQYVQDSTNLSKIKNLYYDFVLSSHVIEHIANPIKALLEWVRVIKDEGILVIILPHKDGTFDHKRPVTDLSHIINDYNKEISESDLTHLNEILELHDLDKDSGAGNFEHFRERSLNNFHNRCLHHHVFDTYSAMNLIDHLNLKILSVEPMLPFHIVIVAKKSSENNNEEIFTSFTKGKISSPFKNDKQVVNKLKG